MLYNKRVHNWPMGPKNAINITNVNVIYATKKELNITNLTDVIVINITVIEHRR